MILMGTGAWIGLVVVAVVVGLIGGFFGARFFFKKQLEKNPPINEAMIRALYQSVGRKPSEADIQRTMNAVKRQQR
ncbi:MAG: YneF family protein [Bacilli bacterium]|nr:YneF family protein [Bacilli bacterium]